MGALENETTRYQKAAIRAHLLRYGEIDKPTAMAICDCDRLGARIYDLRTDKDDPLDIVTDYAEKTNRFGHVTRYAIYRLRREEATA